MNNAGRWEMDRKWKNNRDSSMHCSNANYPALKTHLYESLIHITGRAEEVGNIHNIVNFKPHIEVLVEVPSPGSLLGFTGLAIHLPSSHLLMLSVHPCYNGSNSNTSNTKHNQCHRQRQHEHQVKVKVFCTQEHTNE